VTPTFLTVDLTTGHATPTPAPDRAHVAAPDRADGAGPDRAHLGARDRADFAGPVRALRLVRDAVVAGHTDPYDPAVPVVLCASAVAGRPGAALARCAAVGLSPLSGAVAETRAEGPFGAALVAAGHTGLALTGRAPRPSYLVVAGGTATLHDATDLWGLPATTATTILATRHPPPTTSHNLAADPDNAPTVSHHAATGFADAAGGPRADFDGAVAGIAVIGPAGERGVRYASVVTARHFPLARLGFGALLGDRNLKAVVCLGDAPPPVAEPAALAELTRRYAAAIPGNPLADWQRTPPGFAVWPGTLTDPGYTSVRNFSDTTTLPVTGLAPGRFLAHLAHSAGGCPGCPNDCIKLFTSAGGRSAGLTQETVAALGPNLGIDDVDTILAANLACAELGLDPVSLGGTLACLFEAAERGVLPDTWTAGAPPLRFGATGSLLPLIDAIAGTGTTVPGAAGTTVPDELAEALRDGAVAVAGRLGVPELAMASKGVELPPFDPRVQPGLGLGYAVAPIGPRYDICEHDLDFDPEDGKPHCYPEARRLGLTVPEPARRLDGARADRTAVLLRLWSALDAALVCPYASTPTRPLVLDAVVALVRAVTGWDVTAAELLRLGGTRLRLQYEINDLLGIGPDADTLPARLHDEPVRGGRYAGAVLDRSRFASAARRARSALTGGAVDAGTAGEAMEPPLAAEE
jgi:aldehyde:ferredoxin oxidoreductase